MFRRVKDDYQFSLFLIDCDTRKSAIYVMLRITSNRHTFFNHTWWRLNFRINKNVDTKITATVKRNILQNHSVTFAFHWVLLWTCCHVVTLWDIRNRKIEGIFSMYRISVLDHSEREIIGLFLCTVLLLLDLVLTAKNNKNKTITNTLSSRNKFYILRCDRNRNDGGK